MDDSLVPPVETPAVVVPIDTPAPRNERRCEGCGCKIDVRGRIIERGDKLKNWLDIEDQLLQARKDAKTAIDQRDAVQQELATVRAELARYKSRGFGEML